MTGIDAGADHKCHVSCVMLGHNDNNDKNK